MIIRDLKHWLWKGTLDVPLDRFEIQSELEGLQHDVLGLVGSQVSGLVRQAEETRSALERRIQALQTAGREKPGSGGGDQELRQIARGLLPSLDALDRIIESGETLIGKDETLANWLTTILALRTRLLKGLEGIGLTQVSTVGCEVDLELHDVVAVVAAGEFPVNTVVAEQVKGYYFRGKLLRDAKVVVAQ